MEEALRYQLLIRLIYHRKQCFASASPTDWLEHWCTGFVGNTLMEQCMVCSYLYALVFLSICTGVPIYMHWCDFDGAIRSWSNITASGKLVCMLVRIRRKKTPPSPSQAKTVPHLEESL